MKKHKVVIAILLSFVLLFSLAAPLNNLAKAGNGYGLVIINGKQMYKSKYGNLYPIVILNGKKYVRWHGFELTPVEDVIACESGKSDAMLGNFINKYIREHGNNIDSSKSYNSNSSEIRRGYNQTYSLWANTRLGSSEWGSRKNRWKYTIGNAGCFLCSTASELLRYGLKDPVSHNDVNPPNLNDWLNSHGGFSGANLNYSAIRHFPGISYINKGFDDFNGAARILYQCTPNAPIICFRTQTKVNGSYSYHFCLYVKGYANNPYYRNSHGLWDLKGNDKEETGKYYSVYDSGYAGTSDPRAVLRNFYQIYQEGKTYHGSYFVRPDSGIFRVAFKN